MFRVSALRVARSRPTLVRSFSSRLLPSSDVDVQWLNEHLGNPRVKVIDGSWHMPNAHRNPQSDFLKARIPGAQFFDLDKVSNTSSPLPHMLPTPDKFAEVAGRQLGIRQDDNIVVYDTVGLFSAPRVAWTFEVFGAKNVAVLNGGLPAWMIKDYRIESGPPQTPTACQFVPNFNPDMVASVDDVFSIVGRLASPEEGSDVQQPFIVDARGAKRFRGEEPEPRAGVRSGHMPFSLNVPFGELMQTDMDGVVTWKSPYELKTIFQKAGVDLSDPERPIVTTCGSGVTAAVVLAALKKLGHRKVQLYDGSWSEWGSRDDTPVEQGPRT